MSNSFSMFDFEQDDDEAPDTVPLPGTADLEIKDVGEALLLTVDWTIVANVNEHVIGRSSTTKEAHSIPYIRRWARRLIRDNVVRLRRLGVDVEKTYIQWGGSVSDLDS